MIIQSKYHGELTIQPEEILTFPKGIPAFEDEDKFIVLPLQENTPFSILQSLKTPSLGFVIADVFSLFPSYDIELSQSAIEALELDNAKDSILYCIMTVKEPFNESTVNLQAPVIINSKKNIAKQVVLNNQNYKTRHKLIESPIFSQEG